MTTTYDVDSPLSCAMHCQKANVCKIFIEFSTFMKSFGKTPPINPEDLALICREGPRFSITVSHTVPSPDEEDDLVANGDPFLIGEN